MGKNPRNRSVRLPIWVQHMHKGKWANYRDFATLEVAESWVQVQLEQRDRHAGSWPLHGYRIRTGRRVISGYWYPPPAIERGGWLSLPGVGSVRPMLARAYAESILRACDEIEGKQRADPGPLIQQAMKVAMHHDATPGAVNQTLDALSAEADRYWQDLRSAVRASSPVSCRYCLATAPAQRHR